MHSSEEFFQSQTAVADEVAELAHELATPLTGVLACLQALRGADVVESERQELLDAMNDGLQRALALVGKLSEDRVSRAYEWIDARELVSRCARLLRPDRSTFEVLVEPSSTVWGDRGELSQAVTNVLVNAIEAGPAGGTVTIRSRDEAAMTAILVEDRGPGFPDGVRARLGQRRFTTKRNGSGLGLSITRRILDEHRGSLSFETSREGGALVSLRLPRSGHP